jgi:hypothetical protein
MSRARAMGISSNTCLLCPAKYEREKTITSEGRTI